MNSSFYDLHRIQRETLTIDTTCGETKQKVNFTNESNTFHGTFNGDLVLSDGNSVGKDVVNSIKELSDYTHLSVRNKISAMVDGQIKEANKGFNQLCNTIITETTNIVENAKRGFKDLSSNIIQKTSELTDYISVFVETKVSGILTIDETADKLSTDEYGYATKDFVNTALMGYYQKSETSSNSQLKEEFEKYTTSANVSSIVEGYGYTTEESLGLKELARNDLSDISGNFKPSSDNYLTSTTTLQDINGNEISDYQKSSELGDLAKTNLTSLGLSNCVSSYQVEGKLAISALSDITGTNVDCSTGKLSVQYYTHPNDGQCVSSDLYKIETDNFGHISATTKVTSSDIENLGVKITDTTYSVSGKGLVSDGTTFSLKFDEISSEISLSDYQISGDYSLNGHSHSLSDVTNISDIVDDNSHIVYVGGKLSVREYTAQDFSQNFLSSSNSYLTSTATLYDINDNEISDYQKSSELGDLAKENLSSLGLSNFVSSYQVEGKLALSSLSDICEGNVFVTTSGKIDAKDTTYSTSGDIIKQNGTVFSVSVEEICSNIHLSDYWIADGTKISNWDSAASKSHEHSNGIVLNQISGIDDEPSQESDNIVKSCGIYNFVNSSIATNTGYFKGTYQHLSDLNQISAKNNDYAFVLSSFDGKPSYDRYKYVDDVSAWTFEYVLNNSSFTQSQWDAVNSGLKSSDKTVLDNLGTSSVNWNSAYGKVKDREFKELSEKDLSDISSHFKSASESYLTSTTKLQDINDNEISGYVVKGDSDYKNKTYSEISSGIGLGNYLLSKDKPTAADLSSDMKNAFSNEFQKFGNYVSCNSEAANKSFGTAILSGTFKGGGTFSFTILSSEI